jgi:hypothetical protein
MLDRLTRFLSFEKPHAKGEEDLNSIFHDLRNKALQTYHGPSNGLTTHTVLFRATQPLTGRAMQIDPEPGWERHLGANVTVILTPGDSHSMLRACDVSGIADEISRRISSDIPSRAS